MNISPIKFLTAVWGLQQPEKGYYFSLATRSKKGQRWKDHFFQWPISRKEFKKFFNTYDIEGFDIYFCPTPFIKPRRKKSFVIGSKLLWADLDETNPSHVEPGPSIAWESSKGRYASLWTLDEFYATEDIELVNKALSYNIDSDKGGWDLTQVLRLPGTRNHKYKNSPEVKLLWLVDTEKGLEEFPSGIDDKRKGQEVLDRLRGKIRKTTIRSLTKKSPTKGGRSDMLWKLNNELAEQGIDASDRYALLRDSVWNKFRGRSDEYQQLRREVDKVTERKTGLIKSEERSFICLDEVEAEDVDWLWYPYIPLRKVTLLEGDPGLGKSWITMSLASYISQGKKLPGAKKAERGKVLIMSCEDGISDTIKPRLQSLNANHSSIFAYEDMVILDDEGLDEIEKAIKQIEPVLVIIDPLVAYMGGRVDLNKANETRQVMAGLADLAEQNNVAIVGIRHLTKGSKEKSIYRGTGSVDIIGAARSALMVLQHPDEKDFRAVCHIKSNLAPKGDTLEYSLTPGKSNPFEWEGTNDMTAEQIMSLIDKNKPTSSTDEALEFLTGFMKEGKLYEERELIKDCEGRGYQNKAIKKALELMSCIKKKTRRGVFWKLPKQY